MPLNEQLETLMSSARETCILSLLSCNFDNELCFQQRTGNVNVDKAVTNNNHSGEGAHQHNGVIINNDEPLIKSRSEALSYIEQMDRQSKWYCISDSYVQTVPESRVLNAEAYILFYERVY